MVLPSGKKKEKLIETYEGLSVIGEGVVVEVDEDGEISGMSISQVFSTRLITFVRLTIINTPICQHKKIILPQK